MSGTVKIKIKFSDLGKFERELGRQFITQKTRELNRYGKLMVRFLKLRSGHIKDTGLFKKSWDYEINSRGVSFYNLAYYERWVEAGRRPGKMPPRSAIEPWVMRHIGDPRAVWPIMRKIGREGTVGRPVLTSPNMQETMKLYFNVMTRSLHETAMVMAAMSTFSAASKLVRNRDPYA